MVLFVHTVIVPSYADDDLPFFHQKMEQTSNIQRNALITCWHIWKITTTTKIKYSFIISKRNSFWKNKLWSSVININGQNIQTST